MQRPGNFESLLEAYPIKVANFEGPLDLLLFPHLSIPTFTNRNS